MNLDTPRNVATRKLHVAQSAVAAQIAALEKEVGVALFARTTRRVAPTAAGETLLLRVRRVLGELDGARHDLADLAAVLNGRLVLGATEVLGAFDLPGTLAGFHRRFPGVALSLRSGLIAALLAELDAGTVDLVLGPVHDDQAPRFAARLLSREQMMLALPPDHRLARAGTVPFAELRDEPFVCLPAGSGVRAILDDAAARAGFTARVPFETHSPAGVRELVGAGLGVALLARSAADAPGATIAVRALDPPPAHPPIGLIRRRDRQLSAAARAWENEVTHRSR